MSRAVPTRVIPSLAALCALLSAVIVDAKEPAEHAKAQFERYCASCHGASGKGDGPAAAALTKRPPDLTRLRANAGGTFSTSEVMAAIDGRRAIAAHGSREMPVWGVQFKEALEGKPYKERTTLLTVRELAEYLATIQE